MSKTNLDDLKQEKVKLEGRVQKAVSSSLDKKELCESLIGLERDLMLQEEKLKETGIFNAKNKVEIKVYLIFYVNEN